MSENLRNTVLNVVSKNIVREDIAKQKLTGLLNALKNTVNDIGNNWTSKEREDFIFNRVTSLDFIKDGQFILNNKPCVSKLKSAYNSSNPQNFTTKTLNQFFDGLDVNSVYFLKEPFGSKASPDFLIISSNGVLGIEDKSSKGGKVSFNTGTPGGNKFIMYYDRKEKKIYLISGKQWGWERDIENEYKKFTKEMIDYAKNKFEERFGERIKKMTYYARPMLVDKNKIKDIWNKDEEDVIEMLRSHLQ
jgi:hypothetical protein